LYSIKWFKHTGFVCACNIVNFGGNKKMYKTTILLAFALVITVEFVHSLDVLAYYFLEESYPRLVEVAHRLTQVSFDNFGIDNRGNVRGSITPSEALPFAKNKSLEAYLTVSNYGPNDFNGPRIHAVLRTQKSRNRLINQLLARTIQKNFDGVNIDFEAIPAKDRSRFTSFIKTLANRLHAKSRKLVISVPAIASDIPSDSWSGAFDYAALGEAADLIQIMTYDEHGPWGSPGPIASLPWVQECINYAATVIPVEKISMGIPAYAYAWNTVNHKGYEVGWNEISEKIGANTPLWDEEASSPYAYFMVAGQQHVIWFENRASLRLKMDFARQTGIKGVSIWALYQDNADFWEDLLGTT
jgi:spore germination protein